MIKFINQKLTFFLLYFSEGVPIGFIWWALPAYLEKNGFSISELATISAVATIPWSLKFLFGPIVDICSMKLLSLKKLLLLFQVLMGISLLFVPEAVESGNYNSILIILFIHGIFASFQDICIDALAIKTIPENELGHINGIMQAGMLVGRSVFGGAGIYIIFAIGFDPFIYFSICCIWLSLLFLQKTTLNPTVNSVNLSKYFSDFKNLLKNKLFWLLIFVTYFTCFSYNGISTISSAMLSKLGASPFIHGLTYSLFLPISMSAGALIAGKLSDKKSKKTVLQLNLLFCILVSMIVALLYDIQSSLSPLIIFYIVFYFFIGSTTASLYSLLMRLTSKEFAALEFSIFMGVVNLSDSNISYLTGLLVENYSYSISVIVIGLLSSLSFLGLKRINI